MPGVIQRAQMAVCGGIVAGSYGILHDQLTYTISREYFTNLKFIQFASANFGLGDRAFAGTIGFLASWWVGLAIGWLLAWRFLPTQPPQMGYRKLMTGFAICFGSGAAFAVATYLYFLTLHPQRDFVGMEWVAQQFQLTDLPAFVCVARIHLASYLGGGFGFLLTLLLIPRVSRAQ